MFRVALAFGLLVLDVWAIRSALGSRTGFMSRAGWTFCIVVLPFLGAFMWLRHTSHRPPEFETS